MEFKEITKAQRDQYIAALTDHWQLSFQRWAFLQLSVKIDAIISSVRFEPVTESLLLDVNDRARSALQEWASFHPDCPALGNAERFWVKIRMFPNYDAEIMRMEVSDELRYLSTGTCNVNLVPHINKWPDYTLKAAYDREFDREVA